MLSRSNAAARRPSDHFHLYSHVVACLTALIPIYIWLSYVWTQGLFGGVGSAVLTPVISVCLGLISVRQKPIPTQPLSSNLVYTFLLGLPCLSIAVLSQAEMHSVWFGFLTACWPLWCLAVVEMGFGPDRRAQLTFPVLFLWCALPFEPYFYGLLDTPLQEITADVAVCLLDLFGYETLYWNAHTFYSETFYIIVDETCSGMNLLVTLFMYALIFGWATRQTLIHRLSLVLSVIPLAICSNGVRVAAIYLLGFYGGESVAKGFWHDGSGVVAFFPTLIAIYGLGEWMRRRTAKSSRVKSNARLT